MRHATDDNSAKSVDRHGKKTMDNLSFRCMPSQPGLPWSIRP